MKLHEIEIIVDPVLFRKMRVESGFLYNFYNYKEEEYNKEWVFVPDVCQQIIIGKTEKFPDYKIMPLKNEKE